MSSKTTLITTYCDLQDFRKEQMGDLGLRVFTTFRAMRDTDRPTPAVLHLDYHVERLLASARSLEIVCEPPEVSILKNEVLACLESSFKQFPEDQTLSVRIVCSSAGFALCASRHETTWLPDSKIKLRTVNFERPLPEHKTTSAVTSVLARKHAVAAGAQEALLVDDENIVREGAWSNIFWVNSAGKLHTPRHKVLPGVTRRIISELFECRFVDITLQEFLNSAVEVFVTQSTTGITPVTQVDEHHFVSGTATREISMKFSKYVSRYLGEQAQ